jgi:PIN domain nuclease of toxin-antitoxin system
LIDDCWLNGGTIYLSAVSAWEVAMLADLGRIDLDLPADLWIERFLNRTGIEGVALSHRVAARSYQLEMFEQRDPSDRLLIATAIELACPLVTYDTPLINFAKAAGRRQGFETAQ